MTASSATRRTVLVLVGDLLTKAKFAGACQIEDGTPSAAEIVRRMADAYSKCTSYEDTGTVTTIYGGNAYFRPTKTMRFATAFVRPVDFRLELDSPDWGRYLTVADNDHTRTWWDIRPGVKEEVSLDRALAGATGISSAAAHTVPALLMPERISGQRLTDLVDLRRLDDAKLGDCNCFRIEGSIHVDPEKQEKTRQDVLKRTGRDFGTATFGPQVLWIDDATFLLRRIDNQLMHDTASSEFTTLYEPTLNAEVAAGHLAFDPPRQ